MATKPQVQCDGNSLTLGTGASGGLTYPNQLATLLGSGWDVSNQGVGGNTTQDVIDRGFDSWFDAARAQNIIVLWEITNDLKANEDAAGAYSRIVTLCGNARAAGFKVIVGTCIDRSESLPGAWETNRQTVNTNVRTNWATFADALADFGADPTLGPAGSALNPTYFDDGVHLTNAGYAIIASIVQAQVNILAALTLTAGSLALSGKTIGSGLVLSRTLQPGSLSLSGGTVSASVVNSFYVDLLVAGSAYIPPSDGEQDVSGWADSLIYSPSLIIEQITYGYTIVKGDLTLTGQIIRANVGRRGWHLFGEAPIITSLSGDSR